MDTPFLFHSVGGNNQTYGDRPGVVYTLVKRDNDSRVLLKYEAGELEIVGDDLANKKLKQFNLTPVMETRR